MKYILPIFLLGFLSLSAADDISELGLKMIKTLESVKNNPEKPQKVECAEHELKEELIEGEYGTNTKVNGTWRILPKEEECSYEWKEVNGKWYYQKKPS